MIKYNTGRFGLAFILRCTGSVFPKATLMALPNAILVFFMHRYARFSQEDGNLMNMDGVELLWAGYTSVLSLLIVFRNNQAYTRFWEGATLINQVRGEWFNAISSLFAFCNSSEQCTEQVKVFQHTLIRLASLLYCSALQQVCDLEDDALDVIEFHGINQDSLAFLKDSNDRCEILMQWIQRLVVEAHEVNTIKIAAPLLTRAFQELSRGIVNLNNARKIKDIPFPFPYAQLITCMLIVHWVSTLVMASQVIESEVAAVVTCFFATFALWCLVYITMEIDQPFGEDPNDLPIRDMQKDFNQSLLTLMHRLAQRVPTYDSQNSNLRRSLTTTLEMVVDGPDAHIFAQDVEYMMEAVSMTSPSLRAVQVKRTTSDRSSSLRRGSAVSAEDSVKTRQSAKSRHWYDALTLKPWKTQPPPPPPPPRFEPRGSHSSVRVSGNELSVDLGSVPETVSPSADTASITNGAYAADDGNPAASPSEPAKGTSSGSPRSRLSSRNPSRSNNSAATGGAGEPLQEALDGGGHAVFSESSTRAAEQTRVAEQASSATRIDGAWRKPLEQSLRPVAGQEELEI
mmetsp:Transcript_54911/g.147011  ORF Transcript_54911/g.147011 Transcript_54911/m.147011 type:complete len:570 (-) Transcript_54911:44-1753(-)